ncbi:MAG: T9SS type A sorting domain-containing protein [Bacteroidetes bacterium]|nr:MAG: T9SS type A sorting domain-containing protein [Bacteroidota bacterium]
MKNFTTPIVTIVLTFLLSFAAQATVKTATDGNWNAPGTWSPSGVPVCGDTIVIPAGVTVHIPANVNLNDPSNPLCPATFMQVYGAITFASGRKIRLVAGGCITVELGGEIHPSSVGGGSSELIEIDKVDWWQASDGVLVGTDPGGTQLGCGVLLPVELISYSIETIDNQVQIEFTTGSERDVSEYILESSRDGSFWQEVARQPGAGNSSTPLDYKFTDENPFNGVSYYRLSFINFNGDIVEMEIMSNEFYSLNYLIYPIPVNKTMFLEGDDLASAQVSVVNSVGEQIEVDRTLVYDKYSFNFEHIKSGVYFVVIENNNVKKTERVVVVHK